MSISGVGGGAPVMRFQPPTFDSLDSNSSGDVTLDELKSAGPGGAGDAKSAARAEKLFAAMDADGSGAVSSDEKDAFDAKLQDARKSMQFMTQLLSGGLQPPDNSDVFAATDKDGSGSVSLAEFSDSDAAEGIGTDQLSELFSAIDTDGDGSITESESSDFLDTLKSAVGGPGGGRGPGGPHGAGGPPPGPPPGGAGDTSSDDDEDSGSTALDLLTAATSAYSSSKKSTDLLSILTSTLDEAA